MSSQVYLNAPLNPIYKSLFRARFYDPFLVVFFCCLPFYCLHKPLTGVPLAPLWFGWSFLKRFIFQSDGLRYFLGASCLSSLLKKLWTEVPICNDSLLPNERKEHFKTMHLLLVSNAAFTHKVFLDNKSIGIWKYIIFHSVWKSLKKVQFKNCIVR